MFTLPANVEVAVVEADVKNVAYTSPLTASGATGVEVPIPTLPFCKIEKSDAPVEEEILKISNPEVPISENLAVCVEVPIPIFPF
jgi:hypothetical protein